MIACEYLLSWLDSWVFFVILCTLFHHLCHLIKVGHELDLRLGFTKVLGNHHGDHTFNHGSIIGISFVNPREFS